MKIQIQLLSGENLHIRDFHRTKVGDIATGISSQVRHRLEFSASSEEWFLPYHSLITPEFQRDPGMVQGSLVHL